MLIAVKITLLRISAGCHAGRSYSSVAVGFGAVVSNHSSDSMRRGLMEYGSYEPLGLVSAGDLDLDLLEWHPARPLRQVSLEESAGEVRLVNGTHRIAGGRLWPQKLDAIQGVDSNEVVEPVPVNFDEDVRPRYVSHNLSRMISIELITNVHTDLKLEEDTAPTACQSPLYVR